MKRGRIYEPQDGNPQVGLREQSIRRWASIIPSAKNTINN